MYDDIDKALIRVLRLDARARLHEFTKQTGIPKSTVHERIRRLFRSGVRCVSLPNWQELGFGVSALFIIPFNEAIISHRSVNTALHVAPNSLLLECMFSSFRELEDFREALGVLKYYTVIDVLKREAFAP